MRISEILFALIWVFALSIVAHAGDDKRPNVLFIAVDDLNHWVDYLGRNPQTITSNIYRLAARGVRFTRSYCAIPLCNPSRAALMSGLRPSTTSFYQNSNDRRRAIPPALTLPAAFHQAGYYVAGAGRLYHESYPRRGEWDDYLANTGCDPEPKRNTGWVKFASPPWIVTTKTCAIGALSTTVSPSCRIRTTNRSF